MARSFTLRNLQKLEPELTELNVAGIETIEVDSSCRTKLAHALALTHQCRLKLWYSRALHQLFVSKGKSVSRGVPVKSDALTGVIPLLELMQSIDGADTFENRLGYLETRVAVLENARDDTSESDYLHYLVLFQRRQPEFEKAGIKLEFDTEKRRVYYSSPHRRTPKSYDISRSGYKNATAALRSMKRRQTKVPD